ncbi:MAG: hypothetical protein ABI629_06435 [bacterium]
MRVVARFVAALFAVCLAAPSAHAAIIACGDVAAQQGGDAVVEILLQVEGEEQVAGMQNDLTFDPAVFAIQNADCVINPAIGPDSALNKVLSTNSALMDPTRVRNIVVSLDNADPIPSGLLYTCTFAVATDAEPGEYVLENINARASNPQGNVLPTTAGNCNVRVDPAPTPTATPRCRRDEDCPSGEVCVDGECVAATPTPTPIGFCDKNEDCPEGEVCVDHHCVTPTPTATPIGFCNNDDDCPDNQVCVDHHCVTPTPTATPIGYCTGTEDCPEGQVCVNNMCVTVTPTPRSTSTPTAKKKGGGGGGCSCEIDPRVPNGHVDDVIAVLLPAMVLVLRTWRRKAKR